MKVKVIEWILEYVYILVVACFIAYFCATSNTAGVVFLKATPWLPFIGMVVGMSARINLLRSIQANKKVNIWSRLLELIHWFMFIPVSVGVAIRGGVTWGYVGLQILLIALIVWQIAAGMKRGWNFSKRDWLLATFFSIVLGSFGIIMAYIRFLDKASLGWYFDTIGAVVATLIAMTWMYNDLKVFREDYIGYPGQYWIKGVFGNLMAFVWFLGVLARRTPDFTPAQWTKLYWGLGFNVIIGNLATFVIVGLWWYYRGKQKRTQIIGGRKIDRYDVTIDYNKSREEMIAEGKYKNVYRDVSEADIPIEGEGIQHIEIVILELTSSLDTLEDVKKEHADQNFRPASPAELLSFGAQYPDVQKKSPLRSIGFIWEDLGESLMLALGYNQGGLFGPADAISPSSRFLGSFWCKGEYDAGTRFLAVPI